MKKFYSICLQGNVLEAIEYLRSLKDKDDDIIRLEKRYEERFLSGNEVYKIKSDDLWVRDVLNCYFSYFRYVLTDNSIEEAEQHLIASLRKLVNIDGEPDLDEIESQLESIFRDKGYSFLGGITPPFRGPYIWRKTFKREFYVALPDFKQQVTVYFLSDFLLLSWAHFATMGKHYAGGWAKPEGLYYVDIGDDPIDINSNWFKFCFLKHEAQHLSDYDKFPNLNARNLEYRAKLVELIYFPQPYDLIEKFINEAKDDKNFSHSYAAYSIIKQLSTLIFGQANVEDKHLWKGMKSELISNTAFELFLQNTKSLYEAGKETEGII